MRKKFMAGMLAATLALGMNTAVFADSEKSSGISPSLDMNFTLENTGTTSPAVTFSFSDPVCVSVTDSTITNPTDAPKVTVGSITYNKGEAPNFEKKVSLKVPSYESVGVYKYTFKEVTSDILGIECFEKDIYLTVTVTYNEKKELVADAKVYTDIEGEGTDAKKVDNLANTYSAGSLSVKKEVTGNMGNKKKDFTVHVTFTNLTDKRIDSTISYKTADGVEKEITPEELKEGKYTADIVLSDQDTVTFTNIPYGVTYTVTEEDYTEDKGGYDAADITSTDEGGGEKGVIDSVSEAVVVTNHKEKGIDTGINLDSMPYLMMMGVACAGMFTFFTKKRMARED